MIVLGIIAALASSETWTCTFNTDDPNGGYTNSFVVADGRVIETGLMIEGYEVLDDNPEHLTFARSHYNAMLNAGFRLDQVAVVITIDRETHAAKKLFLQDHGERLTIQRGQCERFEV